MTPYEESRFTEKARSLLEPRLSGAPFSEYEDKLDSSPFSDLNIRVQEWHKYGVIVDAEGDILVITTPVLAEVLAELLNYSCENRPFHHPADPSIINKGL